MNIVEKLVARSEMMNTTEVADYLRVGERTIYDLVKDKKIPCSRVTGKWLFPKKLIDRWVAQNTEYTLAKTRDSAPIVAGSYDPLLEWALRESYCGLAMMTAGSLGGLRQLAEGEVVAATSHMIDAASGEFNIPYVREHYAQSHMVMIAWATRSQGLISSEENAKNAASLQKMYSAKLRVVLRQPDAGAFHLFNYLLANAGFDAGALNVVGSPALTDADLAQRIRDGEADVGLGCASAAQALGLAFTPLCDERFDLVMRRRDYFEPPLQKLFAFIRTEAFAKRAQTMRGYDVSQCGEVRFNP
jgi:putative molybdopterin biosynthesis protein